MNPRVGLALGLFAVYAAVCIVGPQTFPSPTSAAPKIAPDNSEAAVPLEPKPTPQDLPNDCLIVASEAAARLASTGAWTRVLECRFFSYKTMKIHTHALCVWQPPTCKVVCIYDWNGSLELETQAHDCKSVANAFGKRARVLVLEAHYLK